MTTTTIPGNDPARILIYGQCPLLTSALSDLLSEQMAGSECVRVHDQEEAMARLHKKEFSLVVIDLDGGDGGVLLLRDVKALEKAPRCIVLITDGSQPALMSAIRMQADGFISKKLPVPQLTTQLTMSAGGELVISDSLTAALALALRQVPALEDNRDITRLSPREADVLYCISNGMSNRQISEQLKISDGTVKVHVKHVLKKLGFSSRVEAALWASETGHKATLAEARR